MSCGPTGFYTERIFPTSPTRGIIRSDRVLYGTDFPNIPYAWDRELRRISDMGLPEERLEALFFNNAEDLFSIPAREENRRKKPE